MDWNICLL